MDKPFTLIIIVVILAAVLTVACTTKITLDNLEKIPSAAHGVISAKNGANVTLTDGTTLYLSNNPAVYDSLKINGSYNFSCYLNYTDQNIYIVSAAAQ